jgi:predicted DNA-binding protein
MKQKVVTISAQISAELEKALNMVCDLEERSKSYLIKKALEKYLQNRLHESGISTEFLKASRSSDEVVVAKKKKK